MTVQKALKDNAWTVENGVWCDEKARFITFLVMTSTGYQIAELESRTIAAHIVAAHNQRKK